jgi:hypothetical protein
MALLFEQIEREGDVLRCEPRAVVEFRRGPDEEFIGQAVGRAPHLFSGEAVHGVGLVAGAHHQRCESQLHALRGIALEDEAVERVEGEEVLIVGTVRPDLREHAAFRGIGIDVAKALEIGRIAEIAERRHAVALGRLIGVGCRNKVGPPCAQACCADCGGAAEDERAPGETTRRPLEGTRRGEE